MSEGRRLRLALVGAPCRGSRTASTRSSGGRTCATRGVYWAAGRAAGDLLAFSRPCTPSRPTAAGAAMLAFARSAAPGAARRRRPRAAAGSRCGSARAERLRVPRVVLGAALALLRRASAASTFSGNGGGTRARGPPRRRRASTQDAVAARALRRRQRRARLGAGASRGPRAGKRSPGSSCQATRFEGLCLRADSTSFRARSDRVAPRVGGRALANARTEARTTSASASSAPSSAAAKPLSRYPRRQRRCRRRARPGGGLLGHGLRNSSVLIISPQRAAGAALGSACLLVSYRPLATRSLNARGALEAAPRATTLKRPVVAGSSPIHMHIDLTLISCLTCCRDDVLIIKLAT